MIEIENIGQPIELQGYSGERYNGRIFEQKSTSTFMGRAIVCLSNSRFSDHAWKHSMNSIFKTEDVVQSFAEFQKRNDISHLIIIPLPVMDFGKSDMVDDLIRRYLH